MEGSKSSLGNKGSSQEEVSEGSSSTNLHNISTKKEVLALVLNNQHKKLGRKDYSLDKYSIKIIGRVSKLRKNSSLL